MRISEDKNIDDAEVLTVLSDNLEAEAVEVEKIDGSVDENVSEDGSCNTMNLHLRTSALTVQLQTKTSHNPMIVELTTRLECALARVNETEERLNSAFYRIGYLESQLAEKNNLLAEFQREAHVK